jgi:hypothetical protein
MNQRERFRTAITLGQPDRPPHWEEIFELTDEAFGRRFPSGEAIAKAIGAERERLLMACVEIYGLIARRFRWDGLCIWHPWYGPDNLDCVRLAVRELGRELMIGGYIS